MGPSHYETNSYNHFISLIYHFKIISDHFNVISDYIMTPLSGYKCYFKIISNLLKVISDYFETVNVHCASPIEIVLSWDRLI